MLILFIVLAAAGFSIAFYAYSIEQKLKKHPHYKPICDISHGISCTKPLKSQYANLVFFSNAIWGMIFYALIVILALFDATTLLLIASIISALISCILGYLLYFKIKSFCILCTSLYLINFLILILAISEFYAS